MPAFERVLLLIGVVESLAGRPLRDLAHQVIYEEIGRGIVRDRRFRSRAK
jgi:hypothetical protein